MSPINIFAKRKHKNILFFKLIFTFVNWWTIDKEMSQNKNCGRNCLTVILIIRFLWKYSHKYNQLFCWSYFADEINSNKLWLRIWTNKLKFKTRFSKQTKSWKKGKKSKVHSGFVLQFVKVELGFDVVQRVQRARLGGQVVFFWVFICDWFSQLFIFQFCCSLKSSLNWASFLEDP